MTQQEARIELKQIRSYYNRILDRKQRLAELRSQMSRIRISKYGNSPSAGVSPADKCRLEAAIDRATKLEDQIASDILSMAEAQQSLIEKIERLPEPYATVLTKRYIHLLRFEKIAVDMNYSYERIRHINSDGVKKYADLQVDTK